MAAGNETPGKVGERTAWPRGDYPEALELEALVDTLRPQHHTPSGRRRPVDVAAVAANLRTGMERITVEVGLRGRSADLDLAGVLPPALLRDLVDQGHGVSFLNLIGATAADILRTRYGATAAVLDRGYDVQSDGGPDLTEAAARISADVLACHLAAAPRTLALPPDATDRDLTAAMVGALHVFVHQVIICRPGAPRTDEPRDAEPTVSDDRRTVPGMEQPYVGVLIAESLTVGPAGVITPP